MILPRTRARQRKAVDLPAPVLPTSILPCRATLHSKICSTLLTKLGKGWGEEAQTGQGCYIACCLQGVTSNHEECWQDSTSICVLCVVNSP